jgi:ribosomal-protein-alanine N-acetyltransferase
MKIKTEYNFAIELKRSHEVIGGASLMAINYFSGCATIGYWIGRKYWRQGLMTEALGAILQFAFAKLKLNRVQADVFTENKASLNLLRKAGFKREGLKRSSHRVISTGKWHDAIMLALVRNPK